MLDYIAVTIRHFKVSCQYTPTVHASWLINTWRREEYLHKRQLLLSTVNQHAKGIKFIQKQTITKNNKPNFQLRKGVRY